MDKKTGHKSRRNPISQFLPLLILLAFYALVALFWNNISWIANGDVWRQQLSDIFPQWFSRPYVLVAKSPVIISGSPKIDNRLEIKSAGGKRNAATSSAQTNKPARHDMITIPKINITAPIITAKTDDAEVVHGLLDSGVVLYPGSVAFGQRGQTVVLGHSAPAGWPKIKYDWVFSKLDQLVKGDMVVVTYNYVTRYYRIVGSRVVTVQGGVPPATVSGNSLILISCWPPGKDLKRIAVEAAILDSK
jgi:LPXTG-site transpeptidase (sortase) family protein